MFYISYDDDLEWFKWIFRVLGQRQTNSHILLYCSNHVKSLETGFSQVIRTLDMMALFVLGLWFFDNARGWIIDPCRLLMT